MRAFYDFLKFRALKVLPERLLLRLKVWHYTRAIRAFDEASEPDMQVVRYLVQPGQVAVDVGANIGIYTRLLSSLVQTQGEVISIEPIPQTFAILRATVRAFALTNVRTINAAVSDSTGYARMQVPSYSRGGDNFYEARIVDDGVQLPSSSTIKRVVTERLDELLGTAPRVDFIKCDVEGHELGCLRGAIEVCQQHQPAWLMEISGNPDDIDSPSARVFEVFLSLGYQPWWYDGVKLIARRSGDRSTNYFFLSAHHLNRLRQTSAHIFQ